MYILISKFNLVGNYGFVRFMFLKVVFCFENKVNKENIENTYCS